MLIKTIEKSMVVAHIPREKDTEAQRIQLPRDPKLKSKEVRFEIRFPKSQSMSFFPWLCSTVRPWYNSGWTQKEVTTFSPPHWWDAQNTIVSRFFLINKTVVNVDQGCALRSIDCIQSCLSNWVVMAIFLNHCKLLGSMWYSWNQKGSGVINDCPLRESFLHNRPEIH